MAANPYLETLQQAPAATGAMPENPYLSLLQDADGMRKTRAAATLASAQDTDPQRYAGQRRVAQYLGYPVAAVEALPELERTAELRRAREALAGSAALQRAFTDADFAKLAHDDADTLARLAGRVRATAKWAFSHPGERNTLAGALGASAFSLAQGSAGALQAAGELPAPLLDFMEATTPEQAAGWRGAIGGNPLRRLAEGASTLARKNAADAAAVDPPMPGLAGAVQSGVRSFGQQVPGMVASLLTGNPSPALGLMVTTPGGSSFTAARGDR